MKLFTVQPNNIDSRQIAAAVEIMRNGGLVAYPTDSAYGIGCDILNKDAIARVRRIKQMHDAKPLTFICSSLSHASQYAIISDYAYRTMKHLIPGPYTFLLDATKLTPKAVQNPKRKRCGIRIPANDICMALVEELGRPIISTTAKVDGEPTGDPWRIHQELEGMLDALVDGGYSEPTQTTVLLFENNQVELVRQGMGAVDFL
ncbi:threonylcarbamoyl-AMP synthase [Desulfurispirillum indicum]|uniref:Sua5/YciO/YrdC/YwlC family protein n=1 Tax=Desulfurispirillum indicum (strain ATCC BAA-1389 / DSM 22839 / S5) TaxID=653733 RepID=E6W434_DESIS|nr:L-threonylcarbamoyladenylate synthase [Desulfurispirillum indicum]ADU66998.1 Sua5/YciO/YrdC/YwlC family protein [Desulfurispirillum indicum S5]UCZ56295.1 threonylcarbamoyl-AMP synthase [Desulfurispirillum indicum]